MFDNKVIVEDSLSNLVDGSGFSVLARLPYYRGLGLSMVEDISVSVDGEEFTRDSVLFSVRGKTWTQQEMENEYSDRWNFGEKATIVVKKDGGLNAGTHDLKVSVRMRVSYLPFVPTTSCNKTMFLAD